MLSVSQLQAALGCTNDIATQWVDSLNSAMKQFNINTPVRQAAFLSQIGYESENFSDMEEDFNYSAEALLRQWPTHFTAATARLYGRIDGLHKANWEMIANIAYANRFGNGSVASGDGWRYRGRGPIETTFKGNYMLLEKACGIPCVENPDLLTQPSGGSISAAYYWSSHQCNELADAGDYAAITKQIQGSTVSLSARSVLWGKTKVALGLTDSSEVKDA